MPSFKNLTQRFLILFTGAAIGLTFLPAAASANPTAACDGTHHSDTGHGANRRGAYDETCDGSPSRNGNGGGEAKGKPCAGCVGNADDKNPKGQAPNGKDHNAGYECDRNHGVGRSNPAHTGCKAADTDSTSTGGTGGSGGGNGNGGDNGTPKPKDPKPPKEPKAPKEPKDPKGPGTPTTPPGRGDDDVTPTLVPSPNVNPASIGVADPAPTTEVLGVSLVRPAPVSEAPSVLASETARTTEGELPLTGGRPYDPAALALALVALGTLCRRLGRRPAGNRVW